MEWGDNMKKDGGLFIILFIFQTLLLLNTDWNTVGHSITLGVLLRIGCYGYFNWK